MDISNYINYLVKPLLAAKKITTTSKGIALSVPTIALLATFHIEKQVLLFLGVLLLFDFVTGILVSFKEAKDNAKKDGRFATKETTKHRWFTRLMFRIKFYYNVIESEKLRLSLLKMTMYMFAIIGAKTIQSMFKIKPFAFSFSEAEWTITIVVISICCIFEVHSIVMENVKKLGYDLIDKLFSVFRSYKEIKKEFKEE
ncbi:hypothetical protein GJU43_14900 [Flavobacterium sp. LC2016-23]|uniref:hypothetical protein n=1 Tax=Flavobacterium sp. LC2016-23 TaxID=2666330 RepID=UPI0012B1117B|nr:hypothetical protein [Flavobacterium sp. LC2016-23]MRX40575.1 hypothetical protein [Flavobacterium sp. LC2016-23]